MVAIRGTLDPEVRASTRQMLQQGLTDLIAASLVAKQVHWSMNGQGTYLATHRFVDEFVDFARDTYDTLAERLMQIGDIPDGTPARVAASPLPAPEVGYFNTPDATRFMASLMQVLAQRFRARMDDCQDLVTQNILIDTTQELEKLSWFWQSSV